MQQHRQLACYRHYRSFLCGWRYCKAAFHPNGKIKPNAVFVSAVDEKHTDGLSSQGLFPPDRNEFTTFYNRLRSFDTFDFRGFIFVWQARNVNEAADVLL